MDEIRINWEQANEILIQIINYLNKIDNALKNLKDEIESIEDSNTWKSDSIFEFKSKCINLFDNFDEERLALNQQMHQLIEHIKNYKEIDSNVIKLLHEMVNIR